MEETADNAAVKAAGLPVVHAYGVGGLDHLCSGYIASIEPLTGFTRTLYRPDSPHNTIFTTERCNSNCLMCSQPPKDHDDSDLVDENLKLIELIREPPKVIGITGGEPTLLGHDLCRILAALRDRFPDTVVHMLTNGRMFSYPRYAAEVAEVAPARFVSAIPLYADVPDIHDYVVQARYAFDQTVEGIYNAHTAGLALEIRVVLHKQTIPRLSALAEYILRNFPFVGHVALMGLEHMGYVKKNWSDLWIDPIDYAHELRNAVATLFRAGINVSVYNLPLCTLLPDVRPFARQSISDYKNEFLSECNTCALKDECAGIFTSQVKVHSRAIKPLQEFFAPIADVFTLDAN